MSLQDKADVKIDELYNQKFLDNDFQHFFLKKDVADMIFDYQHLHVFNLILSLKNNNVAIDGSATGTGKTHTAIAVAKQLNLRPFIICPKSIISRWREVCEIFGVNPISITNYELIRNCIELNSKMERSESKIVTKTSKGAYEWKLGHNQILILDEAHKYKNSSSQLSKLMQAARNKGPILFLSATLADKPDSFVPFAYMLGLVRNTNRGSSWIRQIIGEERDKIGYDESKVLHKVLYPKYGSRMTIKDYGTNFPKNLVTAECFQIDPEEENKLNSEYRKAKRSVYLGAGKLSEILENRQKIESIKVPILIELIEKYLELDKSVVCFVNFRNTLSRISEHFTKKGISYSILHGDQTIVERNEQIDQFQNNNVRLLLSTIQTGGASINLHDTKGTHPRVSIISPSFSSIDLVQALGRIYRTDVKSRCIQKLIFCANTCEQNICQIVNSKINFLSELTDEEIMNSIVF